MMPYSYRIEYTLHVVRIVQFTQLLITSTVYCMHSDVCYITCDNYLRSDSRLNVLNNSSANF